MSSNPIPNRPGCANIHRNAGGVIGGQIATRTNALRPVNFCTNGYIQCVARVAAAQTWLFDGATLGSFAA